MLPSVGSRSLSIVDVGDTFDDDVVNEFDAIRLVDVTFQRQAKPICAGHSAELRML